MATLSALVKAISDVQGLEENQVLWIARYLREAGLIAQGGRGRGGARMSIQDATNLLIGVNAPGAAKQAALTVKHFRELPLIRDYAASDDPAEWDYVRSDEDEVSQAFRRGAPFGKALEALLVFNLGDDPGEETRVTLAGPVLFARIYVGAEIFEKASDVQFAAEFFQVDGMFGSGGEPPDQQVSKTFTSRTLAAVSQILAI